MAESPERSHPSFYESANPAAKRLLDPIVELLTDIQTEFLNTVPDSRRLVLSNTLEILRHQLDILHTILGINPPDYY